MSKNIPLNERIIFALDVSSHDEAMKLVKKLDGDIKFFKVGLQLFLAGWFPTIEAIIARGNKVMVDLKFFDIPETVRLAVDQLKNRGITFVTVHGNDPILKAATQDKNGLKILAITVLTSFGENDMKEMGMSGSVRDLVLLRSKKALEIGCDGVVSSALEAEEIRKESGSDFLIVTPGIRPGVNVEDDGDDQKRIATAREAIINGADHVVIGRPIRNSDDPISLIRGLQREIKEGLAER
ncbi:MAG: orotidine-5'-phosphate decarboxylase [Desulfocapsa sp.]|jgi:orotidine-5'-phosphate decarboxylase|uniref:Orotidine 5'-phosphate decarboxylase n=1 Tax=Desulfotalea psychrophila TaxID=84980 RepID=A0ABS3AUX8_9BACT|nr:orotidine-5'-phosphate decarboxylase [Desulfocapsa sp.]MBN4068325.1 orotidine-5'-phosphate decarboxylase [Desulfotalea psychrophila]